MNKPTVSIGMPVYNDQKALRLALDCIDKQTFKDYELIISDNCSTDDTELICRQFAEKNPRVTYIRQDTNIGATKNFQFVLDQAKGTYFMWAASDDIRSEDFLQYYIDNIGQANAFFSSYAIYNYETNEVIGKLDPPVLSGDYDKRDKEYVTYFGYMCPSMIYGLFKLDLLRTVQFAPIDWSDALLVTNYIKLYGFKTQVSEPKVFFGRNNENYQIKAFNRRFLNPFPFIVGTFSAVFLKGGLTGWYYYVKQVLKVTLVTLRFNLVGNKKF